MLNNKIKSKTIKRRALRGSIIGENAVVLYVLFFFLFFPLMDLGGIGVRMFFLWFACNQAAMAGSKGTKWSAINNVTPGDYATSIQTQAINTANSVAGNFSGITISPGYPKLNVILTAIQHSDTTNNQPSVATLTYPGGAGLPLASPADPSQFVPILQVQINGTIQPLILVPFLVGIPGLSQPFNVTIYTEQQIEDIAALAS